jgi:2-polyprenyl-6-methoxyphenol hydroxylase-like FAD-dependent oxidoreductase
MESCDALIVGGGPAGSALALCLARTGRSVIVLERTFYRQERIGETLPPPAQLYLRRLGLWESFLASGPVASPGNLSHWGSAGPGEADFITQPYGMGWHIDRKSFDALIAEAATRAGARIRVGGQAVKIAPRNRGTWTLEWREAETRQVARAPLVVWAAGRNTPVPTTLPASRVFYDRLVGLAAFLPAPCKKLGMDPRITIEATENGWWYSTELPDERWMLAFMTDGDLLPRGTATRESYWRAQLDSAPVTGARFRSFTPERLHIAPAHTSRLERVAGAGWIAVGDGAMSLDPLSSVGLTTALESALRAAAILSDFPLDSERKTEPYQTWANALFVRHLALRSHFYSREQRWPASPFWQRRSMETAPAV